MDSRKQMPVPRPNPRGLNPAMEAPVILPMTPMTRLINPTKMIAIAKLLMFFIGPLHSREFDGRNPEGQVQNSGNSEVEIGG